VPLSALLQDAWVDGHAPVLALMTKAGSETAVRGAEEKVQVALVRVVLALQELGAGTAGPPPASPAAVAGAAAVRRRSSSGTGNELIFNGKPAAAAGAAADPSHAVERAAAAVAEPTASAPAAAAPAPTAGPQLPPYLQPPPNPQAIAVIPAAAPQPAAPPPSAHAAAMQPAVAAARPAKLSAAAVNDDGDDSEGERIAAAREAPEYLVAWELEVWKKAEEAKWRAELKVRRVVRGRGVEAGEWRGVVDRSAGRALLSSPKRSLVQSLGFEASNPMSVATCCQNPYTRVRPPQHDRSTSSSAWRLWRPSGGGASARGRRRLPH